MFVLKISSYFSKIYLIGHHQSVHSLGRTPGRTPGRIPGRTPGRTPGRIPGRTPGRKPGRTPGRTPGRKPSSTPGKTPGKTPGRTPEDSTTKFIQGVKKVCIRISKKSNSGITSIKFSQPFS